MKEKLSVRNIAAVSLIEIMMILTIIGVVTAASMGLSKPKADYMRNIKLYSALVTLERAGRAIAQEGHIDYSTDIGTCMNRNSSNICLDTANSLNNLTNQLPKVSHRDAFSSTLGDPGINSGYFGNLPDPSKNQYKKLQDGLCQRLASVLKVNSSGQNCADSVAASRLINDSTSYPTSFSTSTNNIEPDLYLPNGQVLYIGRNLYTDFSSTTGSLPTRKVIFASTAGAGDNYTTANNEEHSIMHDAVSGFSNKLTATTFMDQTTTPKHLINLPHETRVALINRYKNQFPNVNNQPNKNFVNYIEQVYKTNKDYFIIYVDLDCKKASEADKKCGSDTLNDDIFAFRMYRDGTVLPDYKSGFPQDILTAKIYIRNLNGQYTQTNIITRGFTRLPYVKAKCYANLAGSYAASSTVVDHMGICTNTTVNGTIVTEQPISECYSNTSETQCKVLLNKPSFMMR